MVPTPAVHMLKNTDKSYRCTQCGDTDTSIIREGDNPRLKCNNCQFMFSAKDSLAAEEAGVIKPSSPEALAEASEPEREVRETPPHLQTTEVKNLTYVTNEPVKVPAQPAYVFVAKDGSRHEFVTKRDFRKMVIKWQLTPHTVYKLSKMKVELRINTNE